MMKVKMSMDVDSLNQNTQEKEELSLLNLMKLIMYSKTEKVN